MFMPKWSFLPWGFMGREFLLSLHSPDRNPSPRPVSLSCIVDCLLWAGLWKEYGADWALLPWCLWCWVLEHRLRLLHRVALIGTVLPSTILICPHWFCVVFITALFSSKCHLRITFPFLESKMPLHDFCSFLDTVLLKTDCGVCGCDSWPHFSPNSKVGFLKGLTCKNPLVPRKGRKGAHEAVSMILLYI